MSCIIYAKLTFEKDFKRVTIDEDLFQDQKISFEDLEYYLETKIYLTPVEIVQTQADQEQFIYNYSSVVLKLNERIIDKTVKLIFENNSYELNLRLTKNKNSFKVKYLLNQIRKLLNIKDRLFVSTSKQSIYCLDDYISISDIIHVSLKPNSPKKSFLFNTDAKQQYIQEEDLPSEASTIDSSDEIQQRNSQETFFDQLYNPNQISLVDVNVKDPIKTSTSINKSTFSSNIMPFIFRKINVLPTPNIISGTNTLNENPFLKRKNLIYESNSSRQNRMNNIIYKTEDRPKALPIKKAIRK